MVPASGRAADLIPIAPVTDATLFSTQLTGVSFGPTGETVDIHTFDYTDDKAAYGSVLITDVTTGNVLVNFNLTNTANDFGVGATTDTTYLLPYSDTLEIALSGQEYSLAVLFLGDTVVSSGASFRGVFPSYSVSGSITNPSATPEPESLLLLSSGVGALGLGRFFRRKQRA